MSVISINAPAMRLQALSALVIGLTLSQPSSAVVHVGSSVSVSSNSSSATKSPASAKVVTPVAVKAAVVKTAVVAAKPHHAPSRATAHVPVQRVSLKTTGNAARNPTPTVTSVGSGAAVQNKPVAQ